MKYIVIKNRMFVYRLTDYDKATNTAFLTLYKNPDDFRERRNFKQIEVKCWR